MDAPGRVLDDSGRSFGPPGSFPGSPGIFLPAPGVPKGLPGPTPNSRKIVLFRVLGPLGAPDGVPDPILRRFGFDFGTQVGLEFNPKYVGK